MPLKLEYTSEGKENLSPALLANAPTHKEGSEDCVEEQTCRSVVEPPVRTRAAIHFAHFVDDAGKERFQAW